MKVDREKVEDIWVKVGLLMHLVMEPKDWVQYHVRHFSNLLKFWQKCFLETKLGNY